METSMETSDDEMDLLGPMHPTSDPASASQLPLEDMNDNEAPTNDEEVLTSDAEELAEMMANRSLEKYLTSDSREPVELDAPVAIDGRSNHDTTHSIDSHSTIPHTPVGRARFRSRPISPSSSPSLMARTSEEEDAYTEENDVSQAFPMTSSPDAAPRYSPPDHLQHTAFTISNISPDTEHLAAVQELEKLSSQTSHIELDASAENGNMGISPARCAMSLVRTLPVESEKFPPRAVNVTWPSPRTVGSDSPARDASSSPSPLPPLNQISPRLPSSALFNLSPAIASPPRTANNIQPSSPSLSLPRHPSPNDPVSPVQEPIPELPQGRALRTRTARQQHPYAFEYAHYKNSMRRAGLDDAIVKLQAIEREKALRAHGHQQQVGTEMEGFIVPEDEESQDVYVPPVTPPRVQRSRPAESTVPEIDMEDLLAGFGGMISDDESSTKRTERKEKRKGKDSIAPRKALLGPKPFPVNTMASTLLERLGHHISSPRSSPTKQTQPASSTRRLPPSSPASSAVSAEQHNPTPRPPSQRKHIPDVEEPSQSSSSSSESESRSESGESSTCSLAAAERKRLRILNRMMPAAWVRRQLEEQTQKQQANVGRRARPDSPLRPGQARTRTRTRGANEPLVLLGDSESENENVSGPSRGSGSPRAITPSSPRARNPVRPRVFPPKRPTQISDDSDNDIVEILSSDDRSSIVEITMPTVDDDEISSWLARSPKRAMGSGEGGGGGGDLINRMLSRTGGPTTNSRPKSQKTRTGYDRDGRKMKQAKLTSIFRASSPRNEVLELSSSSQDEARTAGGAHNSGPRRTFTLRGDLAELLDATILPNIERNTAKHKTSAHNRAVSANVHIREGPGHSQGQSKASSPTRRSTKLDAFSQKSISTDSGIVPFRLHTKFSPSTYIGRGYLQNLINVATAAEILPVEATPVIVFGEHLDTRLTGTNFVDQVRRLVPHWTTWLAGRDGENDSNVARSFRFVALQITFLLELPDEEADEASLEIDSGSRAFLEEDATEVYKAVNALSLTDPALNDASLASSSSWLSFHWFVVELAVRAACGILRRARRISETATLVSTNLDTTIQRIIRLLLGCNVPDSIRKAYSLDTDLEDSVLEIWVCLLYLIDDTEFAGKTTWKPLWSRVESELDSLDFALPYKVYESERRWELIFSFSALEAFSSQTGRLLSTHPPISRWPWVCKTIKDIRLKEDNVVEEARQRRQRVDYYVRIVTARCWLLHTMWGWNYSQPDRLLNLLYPVFQTRKLAKLRDERTDFPTFIRNLDIEHLGRFSNGDTAWSMFLKIFRKNIVDNPASARKLYSAYSPVAVLNFTNENPATDMDLSRLFNSFAMFLVILITDPTSERGADCVRRMQGLVSFKTADMRSREACIRAFQYAGLLFKYYELELEPLVSWMHLMLQPLQDDMQGESSLAQRNRLVVLVLCLVRSVATVTSTCGFDRDSKKTYPEVALLTQNFVQTVFQLDLKNNTAARREIRQFLESFFHTRDTFLATLPSKPAQEVVAEEESQESYGYDEFDLDLDDPEVLAGLDALEGISPSEPTHLDPLTAKERHAAEVFNKTISPAVFENIVLGFGLDNRRLSDSPEQGYDLSEESTWIRIWFGCAKIVVENRQRSWLNYLNDWGGAKDERISRIIDVSAERRVRIYFCYLALKHTPALVQRGSKEQKYQFLLPWFQCLPHHRYTIEHKYTALICNLGLKSDPLLEGLPCRTNEKGEHYVLSSELTAERGDYVRCILINLRRLSQADNENQAAAAAMARARTCVAKLFETMKQTWDHLNRQYASLTDRELIPSYLEFCRGVRSSASESLTTPSTNDLSSRLSWVPLAD
ncbi:hypothetical protein FRC07_001056 [Ceratobasidium sp. 392]|nr:hypothetical protein FRC07_001056 [Ceratobasidium sp. 392]